MVISARKSTIMIIVTAFLGLLQGQVGFADHVPESCCTVIVPMPFDSNPIGIDINPVTNTIYVISDDATVTAIDGGTNKIAATKE